MKKLVTLSWLLFLASLGFSQSVNDVEFRSTATVDPDVLSSSFVVILSDSSQIDKVEIELGSTEGQNDLINYDFDFDVTSNLPNGYSYHRVGNRVSLVTGTVAAYSTFFGRARLKLSNGQYSSYFSFAAN